MRANGHLGGRNRERRVLRDPAGPLRGDAIDIRRRYEGGYGAELMGRSAGRRSPVKINSHVALVPNTRRKRLMPRGS